MLRRISKGIVKGRIWILIAAAVLTAACAATISKTSINYDFTKYLSEKTITRRSLDQMNEEFENSEQLRMLFRDISDAELRSVLDSLNAMDEILLASNDPETGVREKDGSVYRLIELTLRECDANALMDTLTERFGDIGNCVIAGSAASMWSIMKNIAREIPIAMAVALAIVLAVLLITSRAWIEPLIVIAVLIVGIVINMGTNWVFESVSFVTYAVCAILQLALSMDYAIMLLNAYTDLRAGGAAPEDAMAEAVARSFMPVSSSALTTIAGLLSLLFMSFTIGFDIGIALSKGILISVATVFIVMPAMVLLLGGLIEKTAHKPLPLGGRHLAGADYALRRWVSVLLILVIGFAAWLQSTNTYVFSDEGTHKDSMLVSSVFGESNLLVLLIPVGDADEDYEAQRALVADLQALTIEDRPLVTGVSAMVTTGAQALTYYDAAGVSEMLGANALAVKLFFAQNGFGESVRADTLIAAAAKLMPENEQVKSLSEALSTLQKTFNGKEHARVLLTLDAPYSGEETNRALESVIAVLRARYGEDFGVLGTSMSSYDISNAFRGDLMRVNCITIAAILLILLASFRSVWIPVLLVCVIQGATWITMAFSAATHQSIFFISYLICVAIQMGATIDYGILLTNNYRICRETEPDTKAALREALHKSLPTIATSGVILILAGYTVGKVCSVYYISSIGLLIARGATVSVALVLTLLPMLLALLDRFVVKRNATKRSAKRGAESDSARTL